jgi:putative hydrolase of the HAD superfamily
MHVSEVTTIAGENPRQNDRVTARDALYAVVPEAIDAVVFDIGGVFAVRHPAPVGRGMARAGFELPSDQTKFLEAHHHAVRHLADVSMDGLKEYDPKFWMHFETAYLRHLGVSEDQLPAAAIAMRTEVFEREPKPIWNLLLSDNIAAFHRIAAARPVAIVSNNDGTAEQQMIDFGVCQLADGGPLPQVAAIVDSTVVGLSKPDPAIFLPALAALGTSAARTLYVGDTVHADVNGARAAGMPVVQLDPYDLHAGFDHWRLRDLTGLAEHLNV